jgi:DNA-binding transcriptional MerR regulator
VAPKLYKSGEVCEAAGLQPYVLRSWEKEFPGIGVQRSPDSPRLYRQSDLDQVLRIKELVFGEGLTLAGARRRIEELSPRPDADEAEIAEVMETLGADARARIATVRRGLRSLLDMLSREPGATGSTEFLPGVARGSGAQRGEDAASPTPVVRLRGNDAKPTALKAKVVAKGRATNAVAGASRKRASV